MYILALGSRDRQYILKPAPGPEPQIQVARPFLHRKFFPFFILQKCPE